MASKASKSAICPSVRITWDATLLAYVPFLQPRCLWCLNCLNMAHMFVPPDCSPHRRKVRSSDCRGSGILRCCPGYEGAYIPCSWRDRKSGTPIRRYFCLVSCNHDTRSFLSYLIYIFYTYVQSIMLRPLFEILQFLFHNSSRICPLNQK